MQLPVHVAVWPGVYKRPHGIGVLSGSFSGAGGCKYEGRFRAGKFHGKGARMRQKSMLPTQRSLQTRCYNCCN